MDELRNGIIRTTSEQQAHLIEIPRLTLLNVLGSVRLDALCLFRNVRSMEFTYGAPSVRLTQAFATMQQLKQVNTGVRDQVKIGLAVSQLGGKLELYIQNVIRNSIYFIMRIYSYRRRPVCE